MDFSRPDTWILMGVALWIAASITAAVVGKICRKMEAYRKEIARLRKRCAKLEEQLAKYDSRAQNEIHLRNEVIEDMEKRLGHKDFLLNQKWRNAHAG